MSRKTALVICPGRGTYTKDELGYLKKFKKKNQKFLNEIDDYRKAKSQISIQEIDGSQKFQANQMTAGENASALIYACAMGDFWEINQNKIEVVGILGNSMGWYITLAAAGAVPGKCGIELINTMGSMMSSGLIGGQLIHSLVGGQWEKNSSEEEKFWKTVKEIHLEKDTELYLSIRLGGYVVLGGNDLGLKKALDRIPKKEGKYPFRLFNHGAFHTPLLKKISEKGFSALNDNLFKNPKIPMIDGRGKIWETHSSDPKELREYTLGQQVIAPYDFTQSVIVGLKEFAPDCLILLGPGFTLGGAIGQILVQEEWLGIKSKSEFQAMQKEKPFLISMGRDTERKRVT